MEAILVSAVSYRYASRYVKYKQTRNIPGNIPVIVNLGFAYYLCPRFIRMRDDPLECKQFIHAM